MRKPIEGPAAWRAPEMSKRSDWIHMLSEPEIAEIEAAFRGVRERNIRLAEIEREDFAAPRFAALAERVRDMIENGPGIFLIRGFPTERYDMSALRAIYWGMGKHLGTAVTQSSDGDLLGDVRDASFDVNSRTGRGYRSSQELKFHCDSADVTALFMLRTAMTGGESGFASSVSIHNEMLRRAPELVEIMYQPFYWSLQGQEMPGEAPYYRQPIFHVHEGYFACRFVRAQITGAPKFAGTPQLTKDQLAAIEMFVAIADEPEFHFSRRLATGDLEVLNNHIALHARTEFKDDPTPDSNRHLLRLWLSIPNSRPLSPEMGFIYRDQRAGAVRGGFRAHGATRVHETPL